MIEYQKLFDKATIKLESGNIEEYAKTIIKLHEIMTCNCFLINIDENIFKRHLALIENLPESQDDFYYNLAIGFLYSWTNNESLAYKYLTKAVEINSLLDLTFSLRASINAELNPFNFEDAQQAVLLNPSARNYFILAVKNKKVKDSIFFYTQSIKINKDFACAYNNRANDYVEIGKYEEAIADFKECIKLEPKHWAYYGLAKYLNKVGSYNEALDYGQKGLKKHPNNIDYYGILGYANFSMGNFKKAKCNYQKILEKYPNNEGTISNLELCETKIIEQNQVEADETFSKNDFEKSVGLLEELIFEYDVTSEEIYRNYLISLLKSKNKELLLDESNPIYIKLDRLKKSYEEKIYNIESPSEEEENTNKLIQYGLNHKIGFGNYKGKDIAEIISIEPDYLLWCIINLEHFSVENSILANPIFKEQKDYDKAIQINLIKELIIDKWGTSSSIENYSYGCNTKDFWWGNWDDAKQKNWCDEWDDLPFSDPSDYPGSDFC
jgi:tetratricopeptide (TPR) repeat protein